MSQDEQKDRLRGYLSRMAELNAQADALSSQIDAHLKSRTQQTWGDEDEAEQPPEANGNDNAATG